MNDEMYEELRKLVVELKNAEDQMMNYAKLMATMGREELARVYVTGSCGMTITITALKMVLDGSTADEAIAKMGAISKARLTASGIGSECDVDDEIEKRVKREKKSEGKRLKSIQDLYDEGKVTSRGGNSDDN